MGHVFVSYSRRDLKLVDRIVGKLEGAGIKVWIDREDIKAGKTWRVQIVQAIDTCDAVVLMLSSHSAVSDNVRKEIDLAQDSGRAVFIVRLDTVEKLPAELRYQLVGLQFIDLQKLGMDETVQQLIDTLKERFAARKPDRKQPVRQAEIVIQGVDPGDFDFKKQEQLVDFISELTETPESQLQIARLTSGSVHVFMDAPAKTAFQLKTRALNRDRHLRRWGIKSLRLVGDKRYIYIPLGILSATATIGFFELLWLNIPTLFPSIFGITAGKVIGITSAVVAITAVGFAVSGNVNNHPIPSATAPAATEVIALTDTATSPPPTEIPIQHQVFPVSLPESRSGHAGDQDSSATAEEKKSNGGDRFSFERFERPFNSQTMDTYFPELDIVDTYLYEDPTWIFGTIQVKDRSAANSSPYRFAEQIDTEVDGKGDFLVLASDPSTTDWTTDGVQVFFDTNSDVGDLTAMFTDRESTSDGYETIIFDQGKSDDPDMAWIRVSPLDPNTIELAVKRSVLGNPLHYMVDMWTGHAILQPALFDYSDHYTHEQAGAADPSFPAFYPIKAVYELDNTCRMAVGFQPTGYEPGICKQPFANPASEAPGVESVVCNPTPVQLFVCSLNGGTWIGRTCRCYIPPSPEPPH